MARYRGSTLGSCRLAASSPGGSVALFIAGFVSLFGGVGGLVAFGMAYLGAVGENGPFCSGGGVTGTWAGTGAAIS